jgi:predicted acetyltransferase
MSVEIRTIAPDEVRAWVDAMRAGFLEGPAPDAAEAEFRAGHFDLDHTWAAVDDPRIVGTLRSFDTTLAVPGHQVVSAAALTHVTVSASHRRRGLLSSMIDADLRACARRGDAVGTLVAAEWPIYGRFGYGPAAEAVRLVVDTRGLTIDGDRTGRVDTVDVDTYRQVAGEIYDRYQATQPGAIGRPAWLWDIGLGRPKLQGRTVPTFFAISRDEAGEPDGFLSYDVKDHWEGQRPHNTLEVEDLVGVDVAASNRLWRYCLEVDWVSTVSAADHRIGEPLRWILGDARAMGEHDRTDLLWVRILDVTAALAARRYLTTGRVVLEVDDPMGLSGGRFALEGGPDGADCASTTAPADLALSVSTLSSAYLGGYTLADLARGGRIREHRAGALATADAMFRSPVPPWCVTHF